MKPYSAGAGIPAGKRRDMEKQIIDVHHHIIPDIYRNTLADCGIYASGGKRIDAWTPEKSLEHMDSLGIQTGICSISEPALYPVTAQNPEKSASVARQLNEYMAELKERFPGRFGGFAVLPMPDISSSIAEIQYAVDVLKLEGVGLLSNYGDHYLGNTELDPVFEILNDKNAIVYVHPSVPPAPQYMPRPQFLPFDYLLEFCFQTTRAAMNLILSGTTRRYPNIRFIFSHMGGAVPYLGWRVDNCFSSIITGEKTKAMPDSVWKSWQSLKETDVLSELGRYYYDTALATHINALQSVENLAPGHTLFGSDSFYASLEKGKGFVKSLSLLLDEKFLKEVYYKNAESLFPDLIRRKFSR